MRSTGVPLITVPSMPIRTPFLRGEGPQVLAMEGGAGSLVGRHDMLARREGPPAVGARRFSGLGVGERRLRDDVGDGVLDEPFVVGLSLSACDEFQRPLLHGQGRQSPQIEAVRIVCRSQKQVRDTDDLEFESRFPRKVCAFIEDDLGQCAVHVAEADEGEIVGTGHKFS